MRHLCSYIRKYGSLEGPIIYRTLQREAALARSLESVLPRPARWPASAADREACVRISGPDRYGAHDHPESFAVECSIGTPRFSGIAASRKPKLYVMSVDESPIYVGITKQPKSYS